MKKKVLYIQPLHKSGMDKLSEKYEVIIANNENKEHLKSIIPDVNAIVTRLTVIDKELITAGKNLEAIAKHGIGVDNIDVEAATERNITVLTTGNANSLSVAEHAFFAMGAMCKRITYFDDQMRKGNWKSRDTLGSKDMTGKLLGIIGLGNIGSNVAKMAKEGFGMQVEVYDPYADQEAVVSLGYKYVKDVDTICREADFITVHVPLNDDTKNLIDKRRLSMMKSTACLVNFARGGIVNEKDLYEALKNKTIATAALDVFEEEPLSLASPLLELDNVVLSPHCATFSEDSRIRMSLQVAEGVDDVLSGRAPKFAANKSVIWGR
jgi:D-3-phosphoglycerate dehydrogenase